ncbi:MAG TPA: DEAD/DEAH box helicase [Pseudonocardiaceae bacterium]|jgi:DEAD/DEAH box helicase domain-containing protein|nr:DEAD/DEAH box helicase [Pseudonocardiaceae bacterium]
MHHGAGQALLQRLLAGRDESPLRHAAVLPARAASTVAWPPWVPDQLRAGLRAAGVTAPWSHQVAAAELARAGRHVVVATGTASGKSLAYHLPVLAGLLEHPQASALYLSPTKALGADQIRAVRALDLDGVRPATYDGDTPMAERDWVRAHARWVFTNPDMLHHGLLAGHGRWARFLRRLRFVVIDECHAYRGVFGSHVALLLRRLRRVAARYGAQPMFVLASATVADPAGSASGLTGLDTVAVTEDGAPRGERTVALWEPPLLDELTGENGAPVRRSAGAEAARLLADLVVEGARTLVFVRSRRGAELTALSAQRTLSAASAPDLAARIAAYRAGYLPEERRALEAALDSGELLGVAATNALELGVDIAGLDAVVLAGYPGTRASFWQQAGRAGRAGAGALVVFVARDDPLDTYLVHHGAALLGAPVEATVLDPGNPYVLRPQLACAAAELPLTDACVDTFGAAARTVVAELVAEGVLRRRPGGWFWAAPGERPHPGVDLRGSDAAQVAVVEAGTGRLLGTVDAGSACAAVHPGAVYLHRGDSFVVDELDLEAGVALVHPAQPEWTTSARSSTDIRVVAVLDQRRCGGVSVALGEVEVTSQVVGYLRRLPSGQVLDAVPLQLPPSTLRTRAVWYTIAEELLETAGLASSSWPGALHAAEHAAIGLLPLVATCDRGDIGGVSTARHPDTGEPTVFVHDGHPGGAGFADRGHAALRPWLTATREAIVACECSAGCPSCVQSPKCGNGNEPLDKAGAVVLLETVLGTLPVDGLLR